jgi:hypothetical protein
MKTNTQTKLPGALLGYITVNLPPSSKPLNRANMELKRTLQKLCEFSEAARDGKLRWSLEIFHSGKHWHTTAHIVQTLQPATKSPTTPTHAGIGRRHTTKGK